MIKFTVIRPIYFYLIFIGKTVFYLLWLGSGSALDGGWIRICIVNFNWIWIRMQWLWIQSTGSRNYSFSDKFPILFTWRKSLSTTSPLFYLRKNNCIFRLKLKNFLTPGKAKKGGAAVEVVEPPTHATVYVAKSYPPWQCIILDTLRYCTDENIVFRCDSDKNSLAIIIYVLKVHFLKYVEV